jgi:hypothetical protein
MFTFESIVDTLTGAQTKFVETFVTDKSIKADVIKLINSQANFTKTTYKSSLEIAEMMAKNITEATKAFAPKKAGA